jgi:hypothetical protein
MALKPLHRARRFFGSLFGGSPAPTEEAWARSWLSPAEARLFEQMRGMDRQHAVAVGRAVERHWEGEPPRWVMAAALLHDVGKTVADLGVYGRVVATLSEWVGGADMAEHWADTTGFTRRVGLYLMYPKLGADLLAINEADPRVVAWSIEHHLPEADWTVPVDAGRLLSAADDGKLGA